MTWVSDVLPSMEAIRAIPGSMGLRPHRCFVVVRTWTGSDVGEGTYSDSETELLESDQPPHVRTLSGEEIAVNQLPSDTLQIGNMTPTHSGGAGGTDLDLFESTLAANQERWIKLVGPNSDERRMRIVEVGKDSALHYTLRIAPLQKDA